MSKNVLKRLWLLLFILLLVACGNNNEKTIDPMENNPAEEEQSNSTKQPIDETPLDDEVLPGTVKMNEDVKIEENPKYPVGSKVRILVNRMEGMQDAEGVIVGAYDTTAYAVKYLPTTGGDKVEYKWVIEEELKGASSAHLKEGIDVIIYADHIEGMEGASGETLYSDDSTVYMVDFTTTKGKQVKNYRWLTEKELSPVE